MNTEQNETKLDSSQMDSINIRIATLLIETPAVTDQEIANQLSLSRQTVNRRRNSHAVQELVRNTLAIPEKEVRRLVSKALLRLEKLLDDEDPKIRLAATLALVKIGSKLMTNSFNQIFLDL
ncbi:MAG: HEAT repeat domain-containing protein [Pseudobdellovibrionaceae bacterium]